MLTNAQIKAANELFYARPSVAEGTRVIVDSVARKDFYDRVRAVMAHNKVAAADIDAFCDLAGVPS
jgi:hypothetical protein